MRFEFHPDALAEYKDAARHYAERRAGLEQRFIDAVESAIELIVRSPLAWRVVEGDVRRCLTRVFPYAVLYTMEPDHILILAVTHERRRPGYWRERVRPIG